MKEVIIACDFKDISELDSLLLKMKDTRPFLKIGMEMFYQYGNDLVRRLIGDGYKIFLDLKCHDIPTTVNKAMCQLGKLNVNMVNVHASGGIEMMRAAKLAIMETSKVKTEVIAVTQLTSTDEKMLKNELLIDKSMQDTVFKYAENVKAAGLDGVVCSALEVPLINKLNLISVTPGIRFADNSVNDQKRVVTPLDAHKLNSSYIVVGRAITGDNNPVDAYNKCVRQFSLGIE